MIIIMNRMMKKSIAMEGLKYKVMVKKTHLPMNQIYSSNNKNGVDIKKTKANILRDTETMVDSANNEESFTIP